jgi:hypothetical protein
MILFPYAKFIRNFYAGSAAICLCRLFSKRCNVVISSVIISRQTKASGLPILLL